MPLLTIPSGNVASAIGGAYEVANSCRFNDGDTAYMHKTNGSTGSQTTWTFSCWVKRGALGTQQDIFACLDDTSNYTHLRIKSDDTVELDNISGGSNTARLTTNRKLRDVGAWYHLVWVADTTNGTAGDRIRLYINGTEETSFGTDTQPSSSASLFLNQNKKHTLGRNEYSSGSSYFDGYLAEVCFIDGTALAASSFGEFDEDSPTIWKPKDVSGLTFGTNGFYLDFEDSANLGNDKNGGTDLTEVNLAAADQATDTPTNNFATGNPLYKNDGVDWSEGNLKNTTGSGEKFAGGSTIKVSNGKWYAEGKHTTASSTNAGCGIYGDEQGASNDDQGVGKHANSYSFQSDAGLFLDANSSSSYGSAFGSGDIIGVYLDLDNNKLYFSKNGVLVSSTGKSITDPASVVDGVYSIAFNGNSASDTATWEINFGGCSAFTISSAVSDDNGYGNFEYSPNITGDGSAKKFYALCTKNLAEFGG